MANKILMGLREGNNLSVEYLSNKIGLDYEDYKKLEKGELKMTVRIAEALGEIYRIPPEYFFETKSEVVHQNVGIGSNSNSGYIQNYHNYPIQLIEEILKQITERKG